MNKQRCDWVTQDPEYLAYHDNEWGKPQRDKYKLFEMICLEGQQAGLSWYTVLKKRAGFRRCFFDFRPEKIALMTEQDVSEFIWQFVDGKPIDNQWQTISQVPAFTEISDDMAKALKKKGFKFVGTTTCYAFMQAVGMVNDHILCCFCRQSQPESSIK